MSVRMVSCSIGTADHPIRSGHDLVADMQKALDEMARVEPRSGMSDVALAPALFDLLMTLEGVSQRALPSSEGRLYWEWLGGGIRYWRGHKEMPHGAAQ